MRGEGIAPPRTAALSADVVVIGGGPAGSATATMLARKGWRVLLLERERFPRDHVGESLLPASIPILEELGVLPAVQEAGFLPKWGATMVWGLEKAPWSWYFRETNHRFPHSYQVWRPQFDNILLENARANGVDVREGHNVLEVLFDKDMATGVRYLSGAPGEQIATARFVVDASGQGGLLGRKLGLRRWDPFFQNLAVYAYFEGAERLPPPDETNIFIESYSQGWFWNIPLHTGWSSVGVVVDSGVGQEAIRAGGLRSFLMDQVSQAPYTARMLRQARLVSGPFVVKDWSYTSERLVGDGYILAGDAACFVDPLFSSGVHLALMSGVLAAAYVTTALKHPEMADPAGKVYQELYLKEYGHFREMARLFYSTNRTADSYFWEARRLVGNDGDPSARQSFIRAVAGQPPRGYERMVLDSGEPPPTFLEGVREVESDRAARRARLADARSHPDVAQTNLYSAVPRLAAGVTLRRKPVLGEGEFVQGHVIETPWNPEGTPCSDLVAKLVSVIDGRASLGEILTRLREITSDAWEEQITHHVLAALAILYVDGAIEELHTP